MGPLLVITVHGGSLSPFVRKVLLILAEKQVAHELREFAPFSAPADFASISPLRRIPVYTEDDFNLADSSAICGYVEHRFPEPRLYPSEPRDYGQALWFEEYADTELFEKTAPVFRNRFIRPVLLKQPCREEEVRLALDSGMPPVLDYLEAAIGDRDYLVGNQLTIADIATFSSLLAVYYANEPLDGRRWPALRAYMERLIVRPAFAKVVGREQAWFRDAPGLGARP